MQDKEILDELKSYVARLPSLILGSKEKKHTKLYV